MEPVSPESLRSYMRILDRLESRGTLNRPDQRALANFLERSQTRLKQAAPGDGAGTNGTWQDTLVELWTSGTVSSNRRKSLEDQLTRAVRKVSAIFKPVQIPRNKLMYWERSSRRKGGF